MVKLVCVSDTHGQHRSVTVPNGDIFIFAGDITMAGEMDVIMDFDKWLGELPHKHKIVIAGNHDMRLDFYNQNYQCDGKKIITNAHYLYNEIINIEGINFYGSPFSPSIGNSGIYSRYFGFNRTRGLSMQKIWENIPKETDVLITHSPPFGICDKTKTGYNVGCEMLVGQVLMTQPKFHIFGHIHEGHGIYFDERGVCYANCSVLDEDYKLKNKPIELYYDKPKLNLW